jgi:hypothetical protein
MPRRLIRRLHALALAALLAWSPIASAIDPVTLILLRMLRDKILVALADAAVQEALRPREPGVEAQPPSAPGIPPPGMAEPERLRFLIERNFTYLSAAERDRAYQGLMATLDDPANAAVRPQMVEEFWQMAIAVGEAQRILERLSRAQKQEIAAGAGVAFRELPPDQRQEVLALLQSGQAPIPQDLNAMMLREMGSQP